MRWNSGAATWSDLSTIWNAGVRAFSTDKLATGATPSFRICVNDENGTFGFVSAADFFGGVYAYGYCPDSTIPSAKMAFGVNSVSGNALTDGSVSNSKIISLAGSKLTGVGFVIADSIASDAVVTAKILDANVTAAKLASDAVTTAKLQTARSLPQK